MKDSGVEWIGEIPKDWVVTKIKYILSQAKNSIKVGPFGSQIKGDDFKDEGYKVYNQRTVLDNNFISGDIFVDETKYNELIAFKLNPYDVLITTRGTIGKIAVAPTQIDDGIIHPCIIKFSIDRNKISDVFLRYVFNDTLITLEQIILASNSTTIAVVYSEPLKNVFLPLPDIEKQTAINVYLDRKTAVIDELIADKSKMIELLREKRQAVISEAVTKGLDKTVPMKDSSIEWIGQVPEHWKTKRLKFTVNLRNEKSGNPTMPYIGLESIESFTGKLSIDDNENETENEIRQANLFFTGDVMFGKLRPYLSKAFIADFDGQCSGELLIFKPRLLEDKYLLNLVLSWGFINWVDSSTYGSKMPRANWDFIGNMQIPIPPKSEQKRIADYLDCKTAEIDTLITDIQTQIEKLKEYRQSIISETVTGKVAV